MNRPNRVSILGFGSRWDLRRIFIDCLLVIQVYFSIRYSNRCSIANIGWLSQTIYSIEWSTNYHVFTWTRWDEVSKRHDHVERDVRSVCRATHYRASHYRMMTAFGNHIIALDYRGYGDSTGTPNLPGVIHDVLHVFKIIRKVCPDNPITIWGHSMGTGVALWTINHLFENITGIFSNHIEWKIWCDMW